MRVDNSTGKGTSGMDKFSSEVHRVHMELGGKLLNSLRIKTQFLERLQRVIVVDGATHSQKDGVEGNGGSLEDGAKACVLFLRGAQLVLQSSVLTVLNLDEVNVTLENAEIFGSVLSGEGGSASGSAAEVPPATSKNPPSFIARLLHFSFCGDGSNQYSIQTAGSDSIFV